MWLQYYKPEESSFTRWLDVLDKKFGKPSVRELIVMFGYSGIGKTEFSFFVARRNAEAWNKVQYFSLELPEYDMKQRICLARAAVSKYEFQTNKYTQIQKDIMEDTWKELDAITNLQIIWQEDKTVEWIIEKIQEWYNNWCKMFFIDNLDKVMVRYWGDNENTRYQTVTSKLQDLKNKLDICIILIHHAKKQYNSLQMGVPAGVEWLRGSQKIVDNSTQIFEVFRDLDPDSYDFTDNVTQIIQLKDTFGWPKWYKKIQFKEWTYIEYINPRKTK